MSVDATTLSSAGTDAAEQVQAPARGRVRAWNPEGDTDTAAILRLLAVQPWLLPGRDDEAIATVRRNEDALRDTLARLGWDLHVERDFVRLRKTPPPRLAAWATGGPSPQAASWFFLLVAAAESAGRRVGLPALVAAARSAAAEAGIEVTGEIAERRAVVTALRMLESRGIVVHVDGELEDFISDEEAHVLLAVHHTRLLHVIANWSEHDPVADPQAWLRGVSAERDHKLRMRRRLIDDICVYGIDLDPDETDWLRRRVREDDGIPLARAFGLHLERRAEGAAFVVPEDAYTYPSALGPGAFPGSGTLAHAGLLLIDAAASGLVDPARPGWRGLTGEQVSKYLSTWAGQYTGWRNEDREDPDGLGRRLTDALRALDLLRVDDVGMWWLSPVTGRWVAEEVAGDARAAEAAGLVADEPGPGPSTGNDLRANAVGPVGALLHTSGDDTNGTTTS